TDEGLLLILPWHRLHSPGVGTHARDLAFRQPLCRRCTRTSVAFVEFDVVLLPQLHMPGTEQHDIALCRLLDVLFGERLFDVIDGDDIANGQPFPALEGQNVEQDAAREERFDVVHTELLETIGAAYLLLRQAIIVAYLVPNHDTDVAEPIKLRPYLADFTAKHLVVVHQLLVTKRTTRGTTRNSDREMALPEERNARLKIHAQAIDLVGLDQLCCLKHLGRSDALRGTNLIVGAPGRRPPVLAHRVHSLRFDLLYIPYSPARGHACRHPGDEPSLNKISARHPVLRGLRIGR